MCSIIKMLNLQKGILYHRSILDVLRQVSGMRAFLTVNVKLLHFSGGSLKNHKPVPRLIYVQNPITWLANKLDFGRLRRTWDPHFTEQEFKRGAKQAVSIVSTFISQNMFSGLKELLTKEAFSSLIHEIETTWQDEQRRHISVIPNDIQLAAPRRVYFQQTADKKFCDIDMVFVALKWAGVSGKSPLVFIEVTGRFHRDYSLKNFPDWKISKFQITRFNILP